MGGSGGWGDDADPCYHPQPEGSFGHAVLGVVTVRLEVLDLGLVRKKGKGCSKPCRSPEWQ